MNKGLFPAPVVASRALRPYQEYALELLRTSISTGHKRRPILQLPTGAGKTRVAAEIIRMALAKGKRIAFIVPRLSLINRAIRDFEREGIADIGVKQGLHYRTDATAAVQVCSAQTLIRRGERPEADVVIIDECHLQHQHITKWIADAASNIFIGLTTTPWSKGLGRTYDDLLQPVMIAELIDGGFLSPFRVFAPPGPDLRGVRTTAGDYDEGELATAVDKQEIVADIVGTWKTKGEDRQTLCYGVDRKHAQHLQERFAEAGIRTAYIDCDVPMLEREQIFERFRGGETKIICNVSTCDTGVDLPICSCIIDARPTKSRIRFVQTIGRGLRAADGKDYCVILDHAGNHHRLGLVTEIGCDHLDNGEAGKAYDRVKGEAAPRIATCKSCNCVLPYKARECPSCGEPIYATTPIIERDGELVELGSGEAGQRNGTVDKTVWHGALAWIARDKGYKSGWIAHKFKEKFGHFPRAAFAIEREPTVEIHNWVRSRAIAFAKARARA